MEKNNAFKNMLCLIIGILLSFIEAEFFKGSEYYALAVIVLIVITTPIIYLYFLPKHETMILFLYAIVLVYILDLIGKEIDIKLLLAALFFILVLFSHSLFTANVLKTKSKNVNFRCYFLTIGILFFINSIISFGIYEYILKPNVNEKNQLYISYKDESLLDDYTNNADEEDDTSGSGQSGGGMEEPIEWLKLIKMILLVLVIFALIYSLYKILRYVIWIYRLSKMEKESQVLIMYDYILMLFDLIGFTREKWNTPYEYMHIIEEKIIPLNSKVFIEITDIVVRIKYGNLCINEEEYFLVKKYYKDIKKEIKNFIGSKIYLKKVATKSYKYY